MATEPSLVKLRRKDSNQFVIYSPESVRSPISKQIADQLPKRSRTVNHELSYVKRRSWVLPESPTVTEKQKQLSRRRSFSSVFGSYAGSAKSPSTERFLELFPKIKSLYSIRIKQLLENSANQDNATLLESIRKLQARYEKICDLHELYLHQHHMREGTTNLLSLLQQEAGKTAAKERIDECKASHKENTERLCAVEEELKDMSGSLKFQVLGLIGFARISSGDIYEVQFKHGNSKARSRCKVTNIGQKWLDSMFMFPASLTEDIYIKVFELRKMTANCIGAVECVTKDFMSATSAIYVIPINDVGSVKLKLGVIWSPLGVKETQVLIQNVPGVTPTKAESPGLERRRGSGGIAWEAKVYNAGHPHEEYNTTISSQRVSVHRVNGTANGKANGVSRANDENVEKRAVDVANQIIKVIAPMRGQFTELQHLDKELMKMLDVINTFPLLRRRPSMTPSIESALESFDFLDDNQSQFQMKTHSESSSSFSPNGDSFANGDTKSRKTITLEHWVLVQRVLLHHLLICQDLVKYVGKAFGPMQTKQSAALNKLETQCINIRKLLSIACLSSSKEITPELACPSMDEHMSLKNAWDVCITDNPLCTDREHILQAFKALCHHVQEKDDDERFREEVCAMAYDRLTDREFASTDYKFVSIFEFNDFFLILQRDHSVSTYISGVRDELSVLNTLRSRDDLVVLSALKNPDSALFVPSCLRGLAVLMARGNATVASTAGKFLVRLSGESKVTASEIYMDLLEDSSPDVRSGACLAIAKLNLSSGISALEFLRKCDTKVVQLAADQALRSFASPQPRPRLTTNGSQSPKMKRR